MRTRLTLGVLCGFLGVLCPGAAQELIAPGPSGKDALPHVEAIT